MKSSKLAATLLTGLTLTLASIFSLTGTAYADAGAWVNFNTGRCMDDSSTYGLRSLGCNGLSHQQWQQIQYATPNGMRWAIRNQYTGRCIDDSTAHGLRSLGCNGLNYQLWNVIWNSAAGGWAIKNDNTGRCIDDSTAHGLRSLGCNGLNYQLWGM